jgi:hypothetical protein
MKKANKNELRVEMLSNDIVMIRGHVEPDLFIKQVLQDEEIELDRPYIKQGYAKATPDNTGECYCMYHFRKEPCKGSFPVTYCCL